MRLVSAAESELHFRSQTFRAVVPYLSRYCAIGPKLQRGRCREVSPLLFTVRAAGQTTPRSALRHPKFAAADWERNVRNFTFAASKQSVA